MQILDSSSALKIMIDHHQQPENFATYMYSDTSMSSTCEMVYNFIAKMDNTNLIDKDIATCIYVGIMTDTGSFKYRSTTSITHKIVSSLIEKHNLFISFSNLEISKGLLLSIFCK